MPGKTALKGLCTTCVHLDDCNHWRKNGEAVWYCELFELPEPSPRFAGASERTLETRHNQPTISKKYNGLCMNCEERESCTHPQKEVGVWHCEDYR